MVLGDQLTAARSSVEALQDFVPPSATKGVNFITSDHTVIATHIAAKHPEIAPQLVDDVTARIVYDRRDLDLDEAPLPRPELQRNRYSDFTLRQQRAFQEGWNSRLAGLDKLF